MKRELGKTPGPWASYTLDNALRHDRNGDIIARIILWSVGRQNGKTVNVEGLFGWLLDEGRKLAPFAGWTEMLAAAHDAPQARKMYNRLRAGIETSKDRGGHLHERIKTTQWAGIFGGPIEFNTVTGQPGSARGSSAGAVAWDEVLTQKDFDMWSALAPTQSAQRSPVMVLTSSAGTKESVLLRQFYDLLVRIASGDEKPDPQFYGAWWQSDSKDVATEVGRPITAAEWKEIRKANPGLGDGFLRREAIELDHKLLPVDDWRRERLNHFVDVVATGAFNPGVWAACRVEDPLGGLSGPFALGVDVQPGWERATICVAGIRTDGRVGVEVFRDIRATPDTPVTAARIAEDIRKFPDAVAVIAYDQVSGAAASFLREANETGAPWDPLKPAAIVAACMDVDEMIRAGRLAVDDPLLDAQIPLAARRPVGADGAFRFSRAASLGPIDAVMAMVLAAHAIAYTGPEPKIT
jgi:phage terminase large subunit-like protein